MNENINDYQEKHTRNMTLHEGLLLLIYVYFKARTRGKQIKDRKEGKKGKGDSEESKEIYSPSNTKESVKMHTDLEETKSL